MSFHALPRFFYPNQHLVDFLLSQGFVEITEPEAHAVQMRQFRHPASQLYVAIEFGNGMIVLENTAGWLFRYYPCLSAAALVYLVLESPRKAADEALFHVLADLKP